jgi:hypothetical protein
MTPAQVRAIFSALLRQPPPTPRQIAAQVNRVLRRNEEARIYAWHQKTGELPPRRDRPNAGTGPPKGDRLQ